MKQLNRLKNGFLTLQNIPTEEEWRYLAGVMELHGRALAGWAKDSRMKTELVADALKQAIGRTGA
ncbi:hypothetical protein [Paenibacillus abyssi]|uniref:Uncharacterized protein n=1 Tax=Paenibacillus abyssi TaxID=1340531 RepID=A0A917CTD8_9BACL|nr:hypothetical protein [Paenibacillus abyssi]GGF97773.1 hypothetical protein GCM10010916_13770 [Paenibacillus abyssi]